MKFVPDHVVTFELIDDVNFEIPSVLNPPIEFKEGMTFTLKRPFTDKDRVESILLVVTGTEVNLFDYVDGEIHIKVFVKKV